MAWLRPNTHIDTVKTLVNAAIKKAAIGIKEAEDYRNNAFRSKDYDPAQKTPLISDSDARRSDKMKEAVNAELAAELRKIAEMIESGKIYVYKL